MSCAPPGYDAAVELAELATMELTYTALEILDFGSGGQLYGTMEGSLAGERLSGSLRLTNLAPRRPDNVNVPTLRGLLETPDGAAVWTELDGLATLRAEGGARFVTSMRFRTGDERYAWLNTVFAVTEGVLDRLAVGGAVRARVLECRATIA